MRPLAQIDYKYKSRRAGSLPRRLSRNYSQNRSGISRGDQIRPRLRPGGDNEMKYAALATDYDGTIAFGGQVDEPTLEALRHVREVGLRLVMVTGRELSDLFNTFPHHSLFDRIVAENGAVLCDPARGSSRVLVPPPPQQLVKMLTDRRV